MNERTSDIAFRSARLGCPLLVAALLALGTATAKAETAKPEAIRCPSQSGSSLPKQKIIGDGSSQPDLQVLGFCMVEPGNQYFYGRVNIISDGKLLFRELVVDNKYVDNTLTDFWASSIIIENGGEMDAHAGPTWSRSDKLLPYGAHGGTLTIHIYGKEKGDPALCVSDTCGIPKTKWVDNGTTEFGDLPGGVRDFFYQYGPLHGDTAGYFGTKVLAVSYGGTLTLAGYKGACHDIEIKAGDAPCKGMDSADPLRSAPSWTRLKASVGFRGFYVRTQDRLKAGPNDEIVVTTTDYLPGHSELQKIREIDKKDPTLVYLKSSIILWPHNGERYQLKDRLKPAGGRLTLDPDLVNNGVETRAAVALLTRSIRIVSAGDVAGQDFPTWASYYSFGAHMVIRQGFQNLQIQGVEFAQMGQGGRLGRYPVHFHMARKTPKDTYVKESSVNESMTRWFVLHATQGVTLARNVGYLSIGHGYYLETGTETDNNFHSNIGIFARAAVDNNQNLRKIPGILAANQKSGDDPLIRFPYLTDSKYPTVFWITNGWNNFIGNMAAGAGACGAAYWFVPVVNSDRPDVPTPGNVEDGTHMKWTGYAGLQNNLRGTTPLKSFYKNYATSTMMSFQTTGDAPECHGVVDAIDPASANVLKAIKSIAPDPAHNELDDHYYPHARGGNRHATRCNGTDGTYDCKGIRECNPNQEESCAVTVLDHFTSAFHWAEYTSSAIWLRNQWYLVTNSVLSDVQNGGLTFVTGGDYTHSSVIKGYWGLARNSVFIGHTQPNDYDHRFSSDAGPFNKLSGLRCDWQRQNQNDPVDRSYCLSKDEGISMPLTPNFAVGQQLFHIYDGPAYQDSNVFLDITKTECPITGDTTNPACMYGSGHLYGVLKDKNGKCYLPNAAIGWKQPNGFFYPPAFHSSNLFFSNVDIRHYVVNPLFQPPEGVKPEEDFGQGGTYLTATSGPNDVKNAYCSSASDMFQNFSAIDRQTVLNDDDGTLTGLTNTLSINADVFFSAPTETAECKSNFGVSPTFACNKKEKPPTPPTAKTNPYDFVITAVAPGCSQKDPPNDKKYGRCADNDAGQGGTWSGECTHENCYGVPLYRQSLTDEEYNRWNDSKFKCNDNKGQAKCRWPFIRMAGQNMYQRHTLTMNGGTYYIDTSVKPDTQRNEPFTHSPETRDVNVFEGGQTYYVFFLYVQTGTHQTYQIYVGDTELKDLDIKEVRGDLASAPIKFRPPTDTEKQWLYPRGVKDKVLTVDVDFSAFKSGRVFDPRSKDNGLCGPKTFCTWGSNGRCVSKLAPTDPLLVANKNLKDEADEACRRWAVSDLDCPAAGCFGFSFTLKNFNADGSGQTRRLTPSGSPRDTPLLRTSRAPDNKSQPDGKGIEKECYYPKLPPECQSQAAGARQPRQGRAGNRR